MRSRSITLPIIIIVGIMLIWAAYSKAHSDDGCLFCTHFGRMAVVLADIDNDLAKADNDFAFRLFSRLTDDEHLKRNVFISPASVSLALSMALNGAGGSTAQSISKVLGFGSMRLDQVNGSNANMMRSLEYGDPRVEVAIANSLWLGKGYGFKRDFLNRATDAYQAELDTIDFTSSDAARRVNNWVSKSTRGNISDIVDSGTLNIETAMLLVNTVYFHGKWSKPFETSMTTEKPFYLADGTTKSVQMMRNSGEYCYRGNSEFEAISLPYGDKRFSMYIFLPSKESSLAEFCRTLNSANWKEWTSQIVESPGEIMLPRFKMEYHTRLRSTLSAMGMKDAFEQTADFAGMSDAKPLWIDDVIHKTCLEVDEKGTKVAAATAVMMSMGIHKPGTPFVMVVDRPFFCAIVDNQSGLILFMGAVISP